MRTVLLEHPLNLPGCVATVGTFDGVHIGHQAVLQTVRAQAQSRRGHSVVVTFDPHPRTVVAPDQATSILTSLEEKRRRIEALGVDLLAVVRFTQAVRNLSPKEFVETYLVQRLGIQAVVVGYDHGFGKGRSGGLETMQELGRAHGFEVFSVPPTYVDGEPVSSTRVRGAIASGEMGTAVRLMGGGYPVIGMVGEGDRRGRQLGFPTANVVSPERSKLMPPVGVYAAWAYVPERFEAVLNLGYRPTFEGKHKTLEVHLLDFDGNLYGKQVVLELVSRIREEQKFNSVAALTAQIHRDVHAARQALSEGIATFLRR